MKFFKSQTGDTIIEVMMAIVVMSGVLGATFAVSNRSLKSTQANHERFQAQMYANQQAEWIKVYSANNRQGLTTNAATVFCMNGSASLVADTNASCTKESLYKISITPKQMSKDFSGGANEYNTFFIRVTWDSLANGKQDQLELVYGI